MRTIGDYIEKIILPHARNEASGFLRRMDWIWDVYPEASLKRQARHNRGDGIAKTVTDATPINTKEWNTMLNNEETKNELYSFISKRLCEVDFEPGVSLITTLADKVITQPECDTDMI